MAAWEEFEESIEGWGLLKELPHEVTGFKLTEGKGAAGDIYYIAAYVSDDRRSRIDIAYTRRTRDYILIKTIGLHSFCDEKYFCCQRERFAEILTADLEKITAGMLIGCRNGAGRYSLRRLGLPKWKYWRELPKKIGGFELFITPDNPVPVINGSVIILDYVDWQRKSELYILYNELRGEIFGEMIRNQLPFPVRTFDVPPEIKDEDKLEFLSEILKNELETTLREF